MQPVTMIRRTRICKLPTTFVREYNAYNPGIDGSMIAKFGAIMDHAIDELCELIFSGTTIETVPGMHEFANKGDWFYTKIRRGDHGCKL